MMIAFKYNKLHCVNASHEDSNWLSAKSSYSSAFAEFPHGLRLGFGPLYPLFETENSRKGLKRTLSVLFAINISGLIL